MRRLLLFLALLPSLATAAEVISTNILSGAWNVASNWANGIVPNGPSNSCVVTGLTMNMSANMTISNFYQTGGSVVQGNNHFTVYRFIVSGGSLTGVENGYVCYTDIEKSAATITGGLLKKVNFSHSPGGTSDYSAIVSNPYLTNCFDGAANSTLIIGNTTNVAFSIVTVSTLGSLNISNLTVAVPLSLVAVASSRPVSISVSNVTGAVSFSFGSMADNTPRLTFADVNQNAGGTVLFGNSTNTFWKCNFDGTATITFGSNSSTTNCTLKTSSTSTLTVGAATFDAVTANGTLTLGGALTTSACTNNAKMAVANYSVTATTLYTTNTIVASNSTITATTITQSGGTFSNMTSTVRLAGSSNLTNYYNLASIGAVTLTNAPISITGTLYSEASANRINGNGGTIDLRTASTFLGTLANVTTTNKLLNVNKADGVTGKYNEWERE